MKPKRYEEGGDVDPLEEANKTENLDTTPGPKAEPEKPKVAKPRPKPAVKAAAPAKPAPAPESPKAKTEEYRGLPTAAERFSEIRKKISDAAKNQDQEEDRARVEDRQRDQPRLARAVVRRNRDGAHA